ncbi:MAG: hypothetical protein KAI67_01505 [Candidatus Pacebacteria bacterium]|nr:hypothetical protein [Candidatus Paceibacterota bacterium]
MKQMIIIIVLLVIVFSGCVEYFEEKSAERISQGMNVTITGNGIKEGSKSHSYVYPTDAGYYLIMPSRCEKDGCVGMNVTVGGTSVRYNPYYKRNEMQVEWIIINGSHYGWF